MEHQNWDTLFTKIKHTQPKSDNITQQKQSFNNHEKKIDKNIENGTMRTEKIDKDKSLSIQQKRQSKGLTQKDLANKLNIPIKTINEIESGKGKKNPQITNRINRFLNK